MRLASWLVECGELGTGGNGHTCTESSSVLEGLFSLWVGCRWVVVNTWKVTQPCSFFKDGKKHPSWKVLSLGKCFPQVEVLFHGVEVGSPHRWLFSYLATHVAVQVAIKVNGSGTGLRKFMYFTTLVSFLFYMEKRKILIKRNAKFYDHNRKVIVFCLIVIILIQLKIFSHLEGLWKMLFLHGSVFLYLTFHLYVFLPLNITFIFFSPPSTNIVT